MDQAPTEAFDLVFEWLERFRSGDTESLAWILTRPFTCDLRGTRSSREPLDLEETLELSTSLASAFPRVRVIPHTLEAREHRILARASLDARHEGPLDLRALGLDRFEPTGRSLDLGTQTVAWEIVHHRVHRFEVVDGPGLGPDLILERLGLANPDPSTPQPSPRQDVNGYNGHNGNGTGGNAGTSEPSRPETNGVGGRTEDRASQPDRHDAIAEEVDRLTGKRQSTDRSVGDA